MDGKGNQNWGGSVGSSTAPLGVTPSYLINERTEQFGAMILKDGCSNYYWNTINHSQSVCSILHIIKQKMSPIH